MANGDELILDGYGRLVIDASCTGGSIVIRGNFPAPTGATGDTFGTTGTINQVARYATDQVLPAGGTTIDGKSPTTALKIISAAVAGKIITAGDAVEEFLGLDGTTPRVQVTTSADGDRTSVAYP